MPTLTNSPDATTTSRRATPSQAEVLATREGAQAALFDALPSVAIWLTLCQPAFTGNLRATTTESMHFLPLIRLIWTSAVAGLVTTTG